MSLTLRRTDATARYYTETLDGTGVAIPLQMLLIPAGRFIMGSPVDEHQREADEVQHEVSVPPFFMGRYPITQAQWRVVASFPQVNRALKADPAHFKDDNRPVEQVSWYDAVEFCERLSAHTSRPYRLPSEAEWEYACRANTTTPFHFGPTLTTEIANYNGNYTYANGSKGKYREETTPVDHFGIANGFGLCDMHGNVWEWCKDHYGEYDQIPTDGSAFSAEEKGASRVIRGGSWVYQPAHCRSHWRDKVVPTDWVYNIGFRVCCSALRT